jgi:anti-sigma factor RsiW
VFRRELSRETDVVHPIFATPFQRHMRPSSVISEEALHAYIDGALPAVQHFQVAAYLADHPGDAAHSEALRAQIAGIKALFDPVLDEPVPRRLRRLVSKVRPRRSRRPILVIATTILVMICIIGATLAARTQIFVVSGTAIHIPAATSHVDPSTTRRLPVLPPPPGGPRRPRGADL